MRDLIPQNFDQIEEFIGKIIDESPLSVWYKIHTKSGLSYEFRSQPIETDTDFVEGFAQQNYRSERCTLQSRNMPPPEHLEGAYISSSDDSVDCFLYKVEANSHRNVGGDCYEINLVEICDADKAEIEKKLAKNSRATKRRRTRG